MIGVYLLVVEMALIWGTGGVIAVRKECGAGGIGCFLDRGRVAESNGFWRWGNGGIAERFFEEGGGGSHAGTLGCSGEIVGEGGVVGV